MRCSQRKYIESATDGGVNGKGSETLGLLSKELVVRTLWILQSKALYAYVFPPLSFYLPFVWHTSDSRCTLFLV